MKTRARPRGSDHHQVLSNDLKDGVADALTPIAVQLNQLDPLRLLGGFRGRCYPNPFSLSYRCGCSAGSLFWTLLLGVVELDLKRF